MRIDVDRLPAYVLAVSFALASAAASAAGRPLLSTGQDPDALTVDVGEGVTREWTDNIEVGHTNIYVNVASNGTLAISGNIAAGSLVKRGLGRVAIAGRVNRIEDGIFCEEGITSIQDASSLEETGSIHISDGTFEFAGDGSGIQQTLPCPLVCSASMTSAGVYGIIDLKIESPLVVTNIQLESGCIFKRGVGTLAFVPQPGEPMALSVSDGTATKGNNGYPNSPNGKWDISSDYWPHPVSGYSGFNVVEGEILLTGTEGSHVDITNYVSVGLTAYGMRKSASLSVDGISANIASNDKQLNLSVNIEGGKGELIKQSRLELRNGANVTTSCFRSGGAINYYGTYPTATVDRSTWTITSFFLPYGASSPQTFFAMELRNGSAVYVGNRWENYGGSRHSILIERSVMAKNASLDALKMLFDGCDVSVVNGGALYAEMVREKASNQKLNLSFDGGVWGVSFGTLRMTNACQISISTLREAGATIPVADGATAFVGRAISGAGGIAKTGGGTIRFEPQGEWTMDNPPVFVSNLTDSVSLAFEGLFDVREGSAFVESGACRKGGAYRAGQGASIDFDWNDLGSGVAFSGAGSFSNFTAAAATISVPLSDDMVATNGAPSFSSATLGGPVLVDFGQLRIPERGAKVVVATFLSGAPSLAKWLTSAVPKGFAASLRMDGSSVVADIRHVGFTIRLR